MKSLLFACLAPSLFQSHIQSIVQAEEAHGPSPKSQTPRRADSSSFCPPDFTTVFFDDFSSCNPGSLPSSENWLFSIGTQYPGGAPLWGNNEQEYYTNNPANVHINAYNNLEIIPLHTGFNISTNWTSARIETVDSSFKADHGGKLYIEARLKLGNAPPERLQGIWPAFWALGSKFRGNYTNWPNITEWDFMEVVSAQPKMYSTIHCGYAPGGPCNEYNGLGNGGVNITRGEWHTVGFMVDRTPSTWAWGRNETWKSETLNWYLDGEKVFNVTGETIGDFPTWRALAYEEHYVLLNVAVGGYWPGPPNNATADGKTVGMEVDYVGVFKTV